MASKRRAPAQIGTRQSTRRTVVLSVTALLLIGIVVAGVWSGTRDAPQTSTAPQAETMLHVHGLGVDPGDGELYAATHNGLFRIPAEGVPERVSERRQDIMGFVVAGPGRFLGSGHPDPADTGMPKNLGLIESTDGGVSWHPLSLHGEIDFHSLQAEHGRVYGYSSTTGEIMVSEDRLSWDRRAQLAAADLAVSPTDPDELLATTEQGLARSTDGGRTFTTAPGGPLLLLADWPAPDRAYGIDVRGLVHLSTDGGTTWTPRGQLPGPPQAMTFANGRLFVATESELVVSDDDGQNFTTRSPLI
ncbi:glycoside hydrolase [Saccharopolyspora indica]|uniref:F510_1955 family glycosylhydrolase n=1 Tax=Saccharopolyspora indica TaxID=1229659 RepID=UPI0022EB406E|nr:sialidase family protein [Saccharopolyspora indica]MDA3642477.1 sialidase family protein [Saccharopolyspora indica]